MLKKKSKKVILFDDQNYKSTNYDLKINSLLFNEKSGSKKNLFGFKYNILPSYFTTLKSKKIKGKIFMYFGGYDKKNYNINFLKNLRKNRFQKYTFYVQYLCLKVSFFSNFHNWA